MRLPKPTPWMNALAGPLSIVVTLAIVLHDFIFGGKLSNLNPDVPSVFLLNQCFLGEQLQAGAVPHWNPATMTGTPFAADPQAGWLYIAPMILNAFLSCGAAIRIFVVLPAFVAALGVYAFLRGENVSRTAATAAGLVMGLMIAGSKVLVNLPFSDTLAWTALLLACGARCLRSPRWSGRVLWVLLTALTWGQLAAAHLSHGLVIGTTLLLLYLVYVATTERDAGRLAWLDISLVLVLLVIASPLVNLAHLLPVFGYVGRSSLGLGYDGMAEVAARLRGDPAPALEVYRALGPGWPLRLVTAPGLYLGGAAILTAPLAFVTARTRRLALFIAGGGALFYVIGLRVVAETVAPWLGSVPFSDFYRHSPGRFLYGALFAVVILCGLGLDAWRDVSAKVRIWTLAAGAIFWMAVPLALGAFPTRMILFALGAAAGGAVLIAIVRWPGLAWAVPVLLAIELTGNALLGQAAGIKLARDGLETPQESWLPMRPLPEPEIDAAAYVRGGPLVAEIRAQPSPSRLLVLGEGLTWMFRPAVAGVEVANGYNPVELRRYWSFIRSVVDRRLRYNLSIFPKRAPAPVALDLLQVGWMAVPRGEPAPPEATKVASDARYNLYRLDTAPQRFTLVDDWRVVDSPGLSRRTVTAASFDPAEEVVLEDRPSFAGRKSRSASRTGIEYRIESANHIVIKTHTPGRAIALIRNAWDENWRATVDGKDAEVMPADHFVQAVPVPPGVHTIDLVYEDPNITRGLLGSGVAILVMLLAAGVVAIVERRVSS